MSRQFKGEHTLGDFADYTVIDLETTGLSVNRCEIIELSAVRVRNSEPQEVFTSLVKPANPIPDYISRLTGITNDDVAGAPSIGDVIGDFFSFLGDDLLVGHSAMTYDINILYDVSEELCGQPLRNNFLDTLEYARRCDIDIADCKLATIADYYGIVNEEAHRSLSDCLTTYKCYEKMKADFTGERVIRKCCKSDKKPRFSETTKSLQTLNGILFGISCDGIVTKDEFLALKNWLDDNRQLSGNYPFDMLYSEISRILEDGIVTDEELARLLTVCRQVLNPVETASEAPPAETTYSGDPRLLRSMTGKTVCITGEFSFGSRAEVLELLTSAGAVVKDSVTKSVDILIVGGCGSENWACGNYGNKVKKAVEMQGKGHKIVIVKECDILCSS